MDSVRKEWVRGEDIARQLDVSTVACTECGDPCRVPEDVVGTLKVGGRLTVLAICPRCAPEWFARLGIDVGPAESAGDGA